MESSPKSDYGSASSIHQYFLEWQAAGVFEQLWRASLLEYDELEGITWEWQSLDGAMVKAPLALESVGRNPTDRGKNGSKRRRGYIPHVRPRGEEIAEMDKNPDFKARRWVVEVCHSWFNRFRKLGAL